MTPKSALSYLRKVCEDLDAGLHGERLKRALLTVAIPASAGLAVACYDSGPYVPDWIYESSPEVCVDRLDNDYNGLVDCDDPACSSLELCLGCRDGLDNDWNGDVDCSDASCHGSEGCVVGLCDDDADNDGDGLVDCLDPDCEVDDTCR